MNSCAMLGIYLTVMQLTNVRGLKLSGSVWNLMNSKQGNPESYVPCLVFVTG